MRHVFIVGSPRSGTTWVQLLLAQHPKVATAQETHLFDRYLDRLWEGWQWEAGAAATRDLGISDLVSSREFLDLCRTFSDRVLERVAAGRPGATTIVEKTPGHVLKASFIRELYPEASFIHVVRDPRAVVASMRRAGRGWGAWWAPTGMLSCAILWREHVIAGLRAGEDDPAWTLVSYESLADDCPVALGRILAFLDLEADASFCRKAAEACRIDRLREGDGQLRSPWDLEEEPEGFFGRGEAESWRRELSRLQVRRIEYVAGELMERLGYSSSKGPRVRPVTSVVRGFLGRVRDALDRRLRDAIRRL